MSKVWLNEKPKTVEGHTNTCQLFFEGNPVHENPISCHDNTVDIQTALRKADPRFELRLARKDKTVEGHTRSFNIKCKDEDILKDHSCHDNMITIVNSINALWAVLPPK
ncbi:hypothetical protein MCOR27_007655 [Pyricularia oryzae]|uniref:Uncharacterized protein n=5 Tax=Pyricularia TaxID=48558 RepID=A0ABQ8NRE5_PYRGI|nr:uncharacterized protein MGG_15150 [Pyricularia oryzae 70-15]ELQ33511.1 hypothetical protein OOU_Y34scaffold00928g2 [Pyricularia oryzae Y34]KAH8845331.1 hypothetical protein MCOR01_002575 [Pyricularia oryzae]KAI6300953.1 hypothetical protein MCOR33_003435 [Pyricularia grisea]EHA57819.1 hypothetical protein MGG_15150 [Pyricularia oryzae 70-15]KAH9428814.1 hypothetical protein MCOR02_010237 [Pyricularia oryzae]